MYNFDESRSLKLRAYYLKASSNAIEAYPTFGISGLIAMGNSNEQMKQFLNGIETTRRSTAGCSALATNDMLGAQMVSDGNGLVDFHR